jgi:hypothetical protein
VVVVADRKGTIEKDPRLPHSLNTHTRTRQTDRTNKMQTLRLCVVGYMCVCVCVCVCVRARVCVYMCE